VVRKQSNRGENKPKREKEEEETRKPHRHPFFFFAFFACFENAQTACCAFGVKRFLRKKGSTSTKAEQEKGTNQDGQFKALILLDFPECLEGGKKSFRFSCVLSLSCKRRQAFVQDQEHNIQKIDLFLFFTFLI